jgi:two-component system, NarL family, sensor kinase
MPSAPAIVEEQVEPPERLNRYLRLGLRLQLALRALLTVFIAAALLFEPPAGKLGLCLLILACYVVLVGWWAASVFVPEFAGAGRRTPAAVGMLIGDVAVVAALTILTGVTSPQSWTSDVLVQGLFLIPVLAAAQLRPEISAAMAVPALVALVASSWISKSVNEEPWPPIVLSAVILAGLAGGSVAFSLIQRSRVGMIEELLELRTNLLDELIGLEQHERSELSERLHDGALQCVLAARYDLREVRNGSAEAVERVEGALTDTVHLLRDVVRELHPEVLNRSGLKAAIEQLAHNVSERYGLAVDLDTDGWPDGEHTELDQILFGCAREITTNVGKHAKATTMSIGLDLSATRAWLRISDDGIGMSEEDTASSVETGHIGLAAVRTKVLAADGEFDVDSQGSGSVLTVNIPLHRPRVTDAAT